MGPVRFVAFYLLGGLAATAGCRSSIGPERGGPDVGASGAIAGVLGGYILLYPAGPRADADLHRLLLHDHRAARDARCSASGSSSRSLFGYFDLN